MSSYGPPLSVADLAEKLISNGLTCNNESERDLVERRLRSVSYYRLEEYTWPYRKISSENSAVRSSGFKSGVSIGLIWNTYLFDRRLRILLLDAIERFEVAWKNHITQVLVEHAGRNNPQTDLVLLPKFASIDANGISRMDRWIKKANAAYKESTGERIEHCRHFHGTKDVQDLPLWILMEILSFGAVHKLYAAMDASLQNEVAMRMGVEVAVLNGTVRLLHQVRNSCAHHSRVWNRKWKTKSRNQQKLVPLFSDKPQAAIWYCYQQNGRWIIPAQAGSCLSLHSDDTAFVFLLCGYWLKQIAHTSSWKTRVERVVQPHGILTSKAKMAGFVDGWHNHPLWLS